MFQQIIVTLDGSTRAEQALPHAVDLATRLRLPLLVLRAVDAGIDPDLAGPPRGRLRDAEHYVEDVAARLRGEGVDATGLAIAGEPAPAIAAEAARRQDALVVAATHARTELGKLIYGSVAEHLVRLCPAVLLIRET